MKTISPQKLEYLRKQYPKGSRVRLTGPMINDPRPMDVGSEGSLLFIDDVGTFHVSWDNGRSLGLIMGEDEFTVTPPERSRPAPDKTKRRSRPAR